MTNRKLIVSLAVPVLALALYCEALVFILSHTMLRIYGFPVAPEMQTAIEIVLRLAPMLAALMMILTASFREDLVGGSARFFPLPRSWQRTAAMMSANLCLAAVTTTVTAAAVLAVCGSQKKDLHAVTLAWLGFEFAVDIALIGVWTFFLHALTRKVWATLILFLLYVAIVIAFGSKWGVTSFIGFDSTVPVQLTTYSIWPLYDTGAWLFRVYWISVACLLAAVLQAYSHPPQPLVVTLFRQWKAPELRRWNFVLGILAALSFSMALGLYQVQQYGLAKYRGPSPRRLETMLSTALSKDRLHISHYDLQLDYHPDRQNLGVRGTITLEVPDAPMQISYLQLPAAITLQHVELQGAGSYRLATVGSYLQVNWAAPLRANSHIQLLYAGTIHPAGPFDLLLQAKLLKEAFFLTDSDLLLEPRRLACILSNPALLAKAGDSCQVENYTMSDLATGTVRVLAPNGYIALAPGDRLPGADAPLAFSLLSPQPTSFMVACARFIVSDARAVDALPAVRVYRAVLDGSSQAHAAQSMIAFYQASWPAYSLHELRIVETPGPIAEAVAYDGIVSMSDRIVRSRDPKSAQASNLLQLVLAHEIAHQWWGYQVVPSKSPGRLFVLESFAQFSAYKYLQSRGVLTEDAAIQSEKKHYEDERPHPVKNEPSLISLDKDLNLAYHKGPFVLLSIDKMLDNSMMGRFGDLIGIFSQNSPAQPQQIVESLIEQIPVSSRARARSLLCSSSAQEEQVQTAAAKPVTPHNP